VIASANIERFLVSANLF